MLSAHYGKDDVDTARNLAHIADPLEAILKRTGKEQKRLQLKLTRLKGQNQQLAHSNLALEQEVQVLQASLQSQPAASPLPVAASRAHWPSAGQEASPVLQEAEDPPLVFDGGKSVAIHDLPVHSVAFLPNASSPRGAPVFASASWDATVKFYDVASESVIKTFHNFNEKDQMQGIYSVAFAKAVQNVFGCTSCDHSVYLWSYSMSAHQPNRLIHKFSGHTDEVNGIDFHSTQQVCATASDDNSCILWDMQEGKMLRTLNKVHTAAVYGVTFMGAEHQYLCATCCFDHKSRVFDIRDKTTVAVMDCGNDDVIGIDYSTQQRLLATGSDDGLICVWDSRTWKKLTEIDTRQLSPENEVKRVAWSPCGTYLAAACSSQQVLVYRIGLTGGDKPLLEATLTGHTDCVFDVAWGMASGSNRKVLVSAAHDKTSRYWTEVDRSSN